MHDGGADGSVRMISVEDVEELRVLLRRRDPAARQLALATVEDWVWDAQIDAVTARDLVRIAAGPHPSVPKVPWCPSARIQELLTLHHSMVDPNDVLAVFASSSEEVRRGWVTLLASQRSDASLDALVQLIGPSATGEHIPRPRSGLLSPLAGHAQHEQVVALACCVLARPGWVRPAAELLLDLAVVAPLPQHLLDAVTESITLAASSLIDACNRASVADPRSGDLARTERGALTQLVAVIDLVSDVTVEAPQLWWMLLASADPVVGAMGAVRLVRAGESVAPERLGLLARDPIARVDLHDGVAGIHPAMMPDVLLGHGPVADAKGVAEGRLVRWLVDVLELGRAPDETEHLAEFVDADGELVQVFRFRVHSPHWSSARGWMIGVASRSCVGSCYRAEDECDLTTHLSAIRESLEEWPDRREDGAA